MSPRTESLDLRNEFANVRISTDPTDCGDRLRIEDLESGAWTHVDPLELASLCLWPDDRRQQLLIVGPYDPAGWRPADGEWDMT